MERVEAEEEGETSFMELFNSELLQFGAHGSSLSTLTTCSSSSSSTTTLTCSKTSTAEEVSTDHNRASNKRQKRAAAASASLGTIKVRKDKLGDRIAALQQLVSPFGKSDTASVLHEALEYIRFLHDQVQVLSSPYLLHRQPTAAAASLQVKPADSNSILSLSPQLCSTVAQKWIQILPLLHLTQFTECDSEEWRGADDLRSRGLCLVPVACTEEMANDKQNGADLWSPSTNLYSDH